MNPILMEIAACIIAAGVLGLLAGWMIRSASARRTLQQRNARDLQVQAEVALDRQNQIDQLIDQLNTSDAEREDLARANQSLEEALLQLEQESLRQRGVATERRLKEYNASLAVAGGRPDAPGWSADRVEETVLLEAPLQAGSDRSAFDTSPMLVDAIEADATLALEHPLTTPDTPARVTGFVKRKRSDTAAARAPANGSR